MGAPGRFFKTYQAYLLPRSGGSVALGELYRHDWLTRKLHLLDTNVVRWVGMAAPDAEALYQRLCTVPKLPALWPIMPP